jgi:hypothetical protein
MCIQFRLSAWARGAELCTGAHEHMGPMLIYVCCVLYVFLRFKRFAHATLPWHISTFRAYRILFSV